MIATKSNFDRESAALIGRNGLLSLRGRDGVVSV